MLPLPLPLPPPPPPALGSNPIETRRGRDADEGTLPEPKLAVAVVVLVVLVVADALMKLSTVGDRGAVTSGGGVWAWWALFEAARSAAANSEPDADSVGFGADMRGVGWRAF